MDETQLRKRLAALEASAGEFDGRIAGLENATDALADYQEFGGIGTWHLFATETITSPLTLVTFKFNNWDGEASVLIDMHIPQISASQAGTHGGVNVWMDGVDYGSLIMFPWDVADTLSRFSLYGRRSFTPPAGAYAIELRGWCSVSGGDSVTISAEGPSSETTRVTARLSKMAI